LAEENGGIALIALERPEEFAAQSPLFLKKRMKAFVKALIGVIREDGL
jgi:hypothetical protein